ncbi:MAG: hypothetical protein H7A38_02280 [Chlamydiales bacterium]|nr:hypothetical protein [Chlamydiales bacterium]
MKKLLFITGLVSQAFLFGHAPEPEKPCQITPPYSPLSSKVDFTIDVEFLYWYANVTDLDYAIKREVIEIPDPIVDSHATVAAKKERFENKWGPGVRVGLGVIGSEDGWDLYANGFYFDVSTSESKDLNPIASALDVNDPGAQYYSSPWFFLAPNSGSFGNPFSFIPYSHFSAHWDLEHYQIDLELGRKFWISQKLLLRPFIGIRGFHSEQNLKLHASRPLGEFLEEQDEKLKAKQKNWGVGLLSGVNTTWQLTPRWSIYGDASVALTYGRLDIKEKDKILQRRTFQNPDTPEVSINTEVTLRDAYYKLMPHVDLGAGLRFEDTFSNNKYRILLSAGWESHFLFDYNELLRGTNPSSEATDLPSANGNLTLSGFVLRGRLDF